MAQETGQSQAPLLCSTGCGFYGCPRNNGMCSMCYKDFLQRQNNNGSSSTDSSIGESLLAKCSDSTTVTSPAVISPADTESRHCSGTITALATSTEESTSGAKTTLTVDYLQSFDCRCGNVFCSMHRYSDVHNCTFNYKADAAEKIRKENPVIVGEKIQKI